MSPSELYPIQTTEQTETEFDEENATVYWVKSGKTWHTNRNCQSLKKSKDVVSGKVSDAVAAGKERRCKLC